MASKNLKIDRAVAFNGATDANPTIIASLDFSALPLAPWTVSKAVCSLQVRIACGLTTSTDLGTEVWELQLSWNTGAAFEIDRSECISPNAGSGGKVTFSKTSTTTLNVLYDFDSQALVAGVHFFGNIKAEQ
jgi:hypothetical protein